MEWNWFLFSFEGRINRARCWFGAFIWLATNFAFMMIFLLAVSGILRALGNDFSVVSPRTMHPAFYLIGFPLFAINLWMVAATAINGCTIATERLAACAVFRCASSARWALGPAR